MCLKWRFVGDDFHHNGALWLPHGKRLAFKMMDSVFKMMIFAFKMMIFVLKTMIFDTNGSFPLPDELREGQRFAVIIFNTKFVISNTKSTFGKVNNDPTRTGFEPYGRWVCILALLWATF